MLLFLMYETIPIFKYNPFKTVGVTKKLNPDTVSASKNISHLDVLI